MEMSLHGLGLELRVYPQGYPQAVHKGKERLWEGFLAGMGVEGVEHTGVRAG